MNRRALTKACRPIPGLIFYNVYKSVYKLISDLAYCSVWLLACTEQNMAAYTHAASVCILTPQDIACVGQTCKFVQVSKQGISTQVVLMLHATFRVNKDPHNHFPSILHKFLLFLEVYTCILSPTVAACQSWTNKNVPPSAYTAKQTPPRNSHDPGK